MKFLLPLNTPIVVEYNKVACTLKVYDELVQSVVFHEPDNPYINP